MGTDLFVGLAFALAWLLWLPGVMVGMGWLESAPGWLLPLGHAMPLVAVLLSEIGAGRSAREVLGWLGTALDPRGDPRWYVLAMGIPGVLFVLGFAAVELMGRRPLDGIPGGELGELFPGVGGVVPWSLALAAAGLFSEVGWRGWLLPRLQSRTSALGASGTLGVAWAVWHLPTVFLHPGRDAMWEVLAIAAVALPMSILATWFYNGSGGHALISGLFGAFVAVAIHGTVIHGPIGLMVAAMTWVLAGLVVRVHGASNLSPLSRVVPLKGEHVVEIPTHRGL